MKVVVFGAAGWLGRSILDSLTARHEVRAFDRDSDAWETGNAVDGVWEGGEVIHGDITDYSAVDQALLEVDAVIHAAVHGSSTPNAYGVADRQPFLVNLKGLWNVLESAQQRGIRRVVHIGACQIVHPDGVFFDADVRRPDGSLYAVTKRLQEEMCRQFYDAFKLSQVILRPCSIMDSRLRMDKYGRRLRSDSWHVNWVCRHDVAEACRLATEKQGIGFEILHVAGASEAAHHCNVGRTREILGMTFTDSLRLVS